MTNNVHDWNKISESMIDKTIGEKYQLLEELGRGSYGCLFLGQSISNHTYTAVKILSKEGLNLDQIAIQRQEIDIQLVLKHAHLLKLNEVIEEEEYIYMIMELCDGGDLFEFVVNHKQVDDELVKTSFIQILQAIEYMHSLNIYHRDIKLENILLQSCHHEDNNALLFHCKVADFGLATRSRYSLDYGCGSITYLAPEHFGTEEEEEEEAAAEELQNDPYDTAASDAWSLGILLLGLLFGRNPWQEATTMDSSFAEYKLNSNYLKFELFPELTMDCFKFLESILCLDPLLRPTVTEIKSNFMKLDRLTLLVVESEQDEQQPQQQASYDSAIFSQSTTTTTTDSSSFIPFNHHHHHLLDIQNYNKKNPKQQQQQDLFIHDQEKESWWL